VKRIVIVDVTGNGMSLVIRYLRKFGKTPSNNNSFSQDELAAMIMVADFAVEETELITDFVGTARKEELINERYGYATQPGYTNEREGTGHKRSNTAAGVFLRIAGTLFLLIGCVGIVLPLLPTTPFLLLAIGCYARSSERCYRWLITNRWFGEYIKNWHEGKGIPKKTKILTIAFLCLTIGYSVVVVVPFFIGKIILIFIAICVSMHVLVLPTREPDAG